MKTAGMPSQCVCQEFEIFPWNNHDMECPKPQPGHQIMPIALSGQRLKWPWPDGSVNASAARAAIQNMSSKYLEKKCLTNFAHFCH